MPPGSNIHNARRRTLTSLPQIQAYLRATLPDVPCLTSLPPLQGLPRRMP